jgi:hypothetical protein
MALHVELSRVFSSQRLAITQVAGRFFLVTLMGYCLHQAMGPGGDRVFRDKHLIGTKTIGEQFDWTAVLLVRGNCV